MGKEDKYHTGFFNPFSTTPNSSPLIIKNKDCNAIFN